VLNLRVERGKPVFPVHCNFRRTGANIDSAGSAVVAHAAETCIITDIVVIDVVHDGKIYIGQGPVVSEAVLIPISALETATGIAEAIADTTIEPNMLGPIPVMQTIAGVVRCPVRRGPQRSNEWRHDPGTRHPVVAGRRVTPHAWSPNIVFTGTWRLPVLGKRGRGLISLNHLLRVVIAIGLRIIRLRRRVRILLAPDRLTVILLAPGSRRRRLGVAPLRTLWPGLGVRMLYWRCWQCGIVGGNLIDRGKVSGRRIAPQSGNRRLLFGRTPAQGEDGCKNHTTHEVALTIRRHKRDGSTPDANLLLARQPNVFQEIHGR
jgi:hypothetical protein